MQCVSVIVVNWNRKAYLRDCLVSLSKQTHSPVEIIVVDNASQDGSHQMLKEEFPQVKLLANESNQFYCRAQNQGIKLAKGEYIMCLNNDVVLEVDFLQRLIETTSIDEKIGMVCGKIMSWDRQVIDSAGQILSRSRKPKERGYKEKDKGTYDKPGYVFSAGGVAPLYKRRMIEEIKIDKEYFDENYDMFYEDLDIAWRANLFGWRGYYNPLALAYHRRGGTAMTQVPKLGLLRKYAFACLSAQLQGSLLKNRYMTILKNDTLKDFIINLPWIIAYEIKLWAYIIFFSHSLILKLIKNKGCFKAALRKRKQIWNNLNIERNIKV